MFSVNLGKKLYDDVCLKFGGDTDLPPVYVPRVHS